MNLLNRCTIDKPKCTVLCKLNGGGSSSFLLVRLFCEITFFCKNYYRAPDYQHKRTTSRAFLKRNIRLLRSTS